MKTPTPPTFETDPDALPSEEELREAAELRDALTDPSRKNDDAQLARALVLAHSPRSIDPTENRALVEHALGPARPRALSVTSVRIRSARNARFATGFGTLALAAAILVYQSRESTPVASLTPPPREARSTEPLFHEPFPAYGGASSRIDRIASARASDLRENMYARWDVR